MSGKEKMESVRAKQVTSTKFLTQNLRAYSCAECVREFCFCLYLYVAKFLSLNLCICFSHILCLRLFSQHDWCQNYRVSKKFECSQLALRFSPYIPFDGCVITKATEMGTDINRFHSNFTCQTQSVFDWRFFEYVPCKYEGVLRYCMLHVIVTAAHKPGLG